MDTRNVELINRHYDPWLVEGSRSDIDKAGFFNYGYWKGLGLSRSENTLEIAQLNLIETLVSFFSKTDGTILDVACGKGTSSKFLTKYFSPKKITGINISEGQLRICKQIAPDCEFRMMDATRLEFDAESLDNILCIEAAFHFVTRQHFFKEAWRVLRPHGKLAISDVIVHDHDLLLKFLPPRTVATLPKENCLPSLSAYKQQLLDVGFKYVRLEDSTEDSVLSLHRYLAIRAEKEFDRNPDYETLRNHMIALDFWTQAATWCMAYAIK